MIRFLDIVASLTGLIIFFPVILIFAVLIPLDSRGPVFFIQTRVGRNNIDFRMIKFRTMIHDARNRGDLTIGARDRRITRVGSFLRKYKLDEIPQLVNVLKGHMSLVGPRPEVRKFVDLYTDEQRRVLSVRPGITDYASIEYINENEILGRSSDPVKTYTGEIMPAKILLNMRFINNPSLSRYFTILFLTIRRIAGH